MTPIVPPTASSPGPPLPARCDWSDPNGNCMTIFQNLALSRCNHSGCTTLFHHCCQTEWEYDNNAETEGCLKLCRKHHPYYRHIAPASAPPLAMMTVTTSHQTNPYSPAISELTPAAGVLAVPKIPPWNFDDHQSVGEIAATEGETAATEGDEHDFDNDDDEEVAPLFDVGCDSDEEGAEVLYFVNTTEKNNIDNKKTGGDDDANDNDGSDDGVLLDNVVTTEYYWTSHQTNPYSPAISELTPGAGVLAVPKIPPWNFDDHQSVKKCI